MLGFILAAATASYDIGRVTGSLMWSIGLLVGIHKCSVLLQRDDTNGKCVFSLLMFLASWMVFMWAGIASKLVPQLPILGIAMLLVGIILLTVVAVLAILGLMELRHAPDSMRGKKQAIWALVLSVVFITLVGTGFVRGRRYALRGVPSARGSAAQNGYFVFEDLNFKYRPQKHGWAKINPATVNPDATLALMRARPQLLFIAIAEAGGVELDMDATQLAELAKVNMRTVSPEVTLHADEVYSIGEIDGRRVRSTARIGAKHVYYTHWVFTRNGFMYQLILAGDEDDRSAIDRDAEQIFAGFEWLDPTRIAKTGTAFGTYLSPRLDYSLDLEGSPWVRWQEVHTQYPGADCSGIMIKRNAGFLVMPFRHGMDDVDLDALTAVLMSFVTGRPDSEQIRGMRDTEQEGLACRSFEFTQPIDGAMTTYAAKIWAGPRRVLYSWLWAPEACEDFPALRDSVLDALHVETDQLSGPDGDLLDPRQEIANADLLNNLGLYFTRNGRHKDALTSFDEACRAAPGDATYLGNALFSYDEMRQHQRALAAITQAPRDVAEHPDIQLWRAAHLKELGREEDACAIYNQVFLVHNHRDLDALWLYGSLLLTRNEAGRFETFFDKYLEQDDSLDARLTRAGLYAEHGAPENAVKFLEAEKRTPPNPQLRMALIRNYGAVEQYSDALRACEELVEAGFATPDVYYMKADAECGLKWYRRAQESLEQAKRLAPEDMAISELLLYVSGLLGEGQNDGIKRAITAVTMPAAVSNRLPKAGARIDGDDYGSEIRYTVTGFDFERGEHLKETWFWSATVLNGVGVTRYSTIQFEFDPLIERVYLNELVVMDPAGEVVGRGNIDACYVIDSSESDMVTHDKTLCIPVPELESGRTIRLAITKERLGAPESFSMHRTFLGTTTPTGLSAVFYLGDDSQITYSAPAPVTTETIPGGVVWRVTAAPALQWQPLPPPLQDLMPMLLVGDARATWAEEIEDYTTSISDRLRPHPIVRAKAASLTEGATTRDDTINRLIRHVQSDYTYKPLEFGIRGRMPYPPVETMRNKYGDCKDHAVLLCALLKAAGIEASLVLVNSTHRIDEAVPSLDQFDHVIVQVPGRASGEFIDTTGKNIDACALVPPGQGTRKALVLSPAGPSFCTIPDYAEDSSRATITCTLSAIDGETVRAEDVVTLSGYCASSLRGLLRQVDGARHKQWIQNIMSDSEKACEVQTFKAEHVFEPSRDLVLHITYLARNRLDRGDGGTRIELSNPWVRHLLSARVCPNRKSDFWLAYPFDLSTTVTLKGMEGHQWDRVPEGQNHTSDACRWQSLTRVDGDDVKLSLQVHTRPGTYPAARYESYRTTIQDAIGTVTGTMHLKRETSRSKLSATNG